MKTTSRLSQEDYLIIFTCTGNVNYAALARTQNNILRSSSMWMVVYFWRLINPQNLGQVIL
jgi:hypothetical protein